MPIAVLTYFVVATIQRDIDFAQLELKGNAYQRPLEDILDGVRQHEILATACNPPQGCTAFWRPRARKSTPRSRD